AEALDELVHLPAVERLLFVAVVVIHVARELAAGATHEPGRRAVEALRRRRVRVRGQKRRGQAVDGRRAGLRRERVAGRPRRVRIRAEVMVERDVLLEDHDNVLDWRLWAASYVWYSEG